MKTKLCYTCKTNLSLENFSSHPHSKDGLRTICKKCSNEYGKLKRETSRENYLLIRARHRAKKKGLEFSITKEDIRIPEKCPVFNIPFEKAGMKAPSIDRIDSSKGYTKENIQIISVRANVVKWNTTLEELKQLVKFLEGLNGKEIL